MAYEIPGQRISVRWGTTTPATTSDQFLMYVLDSNGYAVISATTSFTRPFGILQDVPTSTAAPGSYMINGVSKVKAAASTLAKGDMFACSSAGLAVSKSTRHPPLGYILDGSSGSATRLMTAIFYGPLGTTGS